MKSSKMVAVVLVAAFGIAGSAFGHDQDKPQAETDPLATIVPTPVVTAIDTRSCLDGSCHAPARLALRSVLVPVVSWEQRCVLVAKPARVERPICCRDGCLRRIARGIACHCRAKAARIRACRSCCYR